MLGMRMKGRLGVLAAVLAVAACLAGCEKKEPSTPPDRAGNPGTPPAPLKRYVIGMIAKSQTNEVFKAARQGAEDAARELSKKYGVEIRVDWRTPVSEDAQKQAENIRQLVSGGANGILISATNAATLLQDINDAVDRGVPVMTFDSDVPQSRRFAYFGSDDLEAGRSVMRELAAAMGAGASSPSLPGPRARPTSPAASKGSAKNSRTTPTSPCWASSITKNPPARPSRRWRRCSGPTRRSRAGPWWAAGPCSPRTPSTGSRLTPGWSPWTR